MTVTRYESASSGSPRTRSGVCPDSTADTTSEQAVDRLWAVWKQLDGRVDQIAVGFALQVLLLTRRGNDQAAALEALGEAMCQTVGADGAPFLGSVRLRAAEYWFVTGRWDDALTDLDTAGELPLSAPLRLWRHGLAALVAVHRGDRAALVAHLRAAEQLDVGEPASDYHSRHVAAAKAVAAERDGRLEEALTLLVPAIDAVCPDGSAAELEPSGGLRADLVRLCLAVRDEATARAATAAAVALAEQVEGVFAIAVAQHCRGLLESEPALLMAAAGGYRRMHARLRQGHALECAAALLMRRSMASAARRASADAYAIYADLKAAWDMRRADACLRRLGLGRRGTRAVQRRPVSGWEALTPSELTIARLVAAGRTNPDIAAELFLSRRTVQTHVSHILAKLGAHTRVDIALAAVNRQRRAA